MTFKLQEKDSRAVDLLLDRSTSASSAAGREALQPLDGMSTAGFSTHASAVDPERLRAAQQILNLLSLMPQEEPPPGLVERTLAKIEQSKGLVPAESAPFRPGLLADPSLPPA